MEGKGTRSVSTRRRFLRLSINLLASAAAAAPLVAGGHMLSASFSGRRPHLEYLGRLGQFRVGTLTWLAELEVFVLRTEKGLGVFSSRCTHLGCTVKRTAEGFVCPCHGAGYDGLGRVTAGPARRPLPWYQVIINGDGTLWLDRQREAGPGEMEEIPSWI
jgi:nitrite reductase/ring-hydroxylating ferredoxin subunit